MFAPALLILAAALVLAPSASAFACPKVIPAHPPPAEDASLLHPGHIDIVLAMGDSITAAFAARASIMEARDASWSIGKGSDAQLTLPYLVDFYRPASNASNASNTSAKLHGPLIGASTTAVFPAGIRHLPHGDFHPKTDGLNVAESSGAVHRNSMVEQFALIQQQRAALPGLDADFDARWKLMTIWMTANDVCGLCDGNVSGAFLDEWSAGYDALLANMTNTSTCVCV